MTPKSPEQTVRDVYASFARGDLPAVLGVIAPDAEWRCAAPAGVPFGGTRRGPAGAQEFFAALFAAVRVKDVRAETFLPHGDRVVVLGRDAGTWIATEGPYTAEWVHVWTVRDGVVTSWHEFLDLGD